MLNFFRNNSAFLPPKLLRQLEEQLKSVSITGRMAYCITCLENIFASEQLHEPELETLLMCLWDFTSNPDLSEWEERIMDFLPEIVLDGSPKELVCLSVEAANRLKIIYQQLPQSLLRCIDDIIEVGRGNLYAGTVGRSQQTLTPTMAVVRHMVAQGYPLPIIDNFLRSPFSEQDQHGWGRRVERSFFQ
ncbi:hypothetical protein LRS06_20110 [Hymenobacter sp. J193]|uniref:hypothetical protein n=1 Tax=Hymenobacter sp. J193 TaxID=2898429 RepID=UPI0021509D49|nr:hypothetical protein [Hymenobacter sp. J193]MCR5890035.1 hypothetical protein [Hymenobacter sp. J193]